MTHALYQVAPKVHLRREDGKRLVLIDPQGLYDFPGGRIDEAEQGGDLRIALRREVREELGTDISYEIGGLMCASTRSFDIPSGRIHVLALHHTGRYLGGEPTLSDEHDHYEWLTPTELLAEPERFVSASEYDALKEYFLEHP